MRRSFYCILLPLLLHPVWSGAQSTSSYIFSHLDTHDGLLSEDITDVCQDRKGFMWVASVSGLQRYDGHRYISFRHNDHNPKSISDDFITHIQQGRDDKLWILFMGNKVGYINQNDLS